MDDPSADFASRRLSTVHAVARVTLALVFLWHGLVPKLLYRHPDEQELMRDSGLSAERAASMVMWIGVAEVAYALVLLLAWRIRSLLLVATVAMAVITPGIMIGSPRFTPAAFTPVTLNLCVAALGVIGWLAAPKPRERNGPSPS
ncbi:MAG TPA: DoxX-like family protein [Longimicrobium sp.]|nr:DoxX-like family protein [Longimicrobium sp.]